MPMPTSNTAPRATRRAVLHASMIVASNCLIAPSMPAIAAADTEIAAARQLYTLCNQRRPSEWAAEERPAVEALVDELVAQGQRMPSPSGSLRGKWRLVYVQPAPNAWLYPGADRSLKFPVLPGSDSYQIVGRSDVINVGELLGPLLEVRAAGSFTEQASSDGRPLPRRIQADMREGVLCGSLTMGSREKANTGRVCGPLPIRGDCSFDSLYVGEQVRVSQNVDGGGARTVHVRITSFGGFR